MDKPVPDPLDPARQARQLSHLHEKGTDALARDVQASTPIADAPPDPSAPLRGLCPSSGIHVDGDGPVIIRHGQRQREH